MNGIYVHLPYCERKCRYCDFYSQTQFSGLPVFLESLAKEINLKGQQPLFNSAQFDSVFIGGGTPSLLPPKDLKNLFDTLHKNFPISNSAEITIECNPNSVSFEQLVQYKETGINRISFGVQSFDDSELQFLGRIHNSNEAVKACELASKAGFKNISLDLIWGIPGQSPESWLATLTTAIALGVKHISAYCLIYEENTPMYQDWESGKIIRMDEDAEAELYDILCKVMSDNGFEHYEISNFAQPGHKCLHNLIYWKGGDYIGFGPSAHSFVEGKRSWNYSDLTKYNQLLKNDELPVESVETLTDTQILNEMIMLGLRSEGLEIKKINKKFNLDLMEQLKPLITNFINKDLLIADKDRLCLTDSGYLLCQEITLQFVMQTEKLIAVNSAR
jgi:oxygen-independent coproporphyrinogen III oxidase